MFTRLLAVDSVAVTDSEEMAVIALAASFHAVLHHESGLQNEAVLVDLVGVGWNEADSGSKRVLGDDVALNVLFHRSLRLLFVGLLVHLSHRRH